MKMELELPNDFESTIQSLINETVSEKLDAIKSSNEYGEYLDIGTAAKYLGVSRNTFSKKILKSSGIPITVIADRITRIKKSDLDKYMSDKAI